MDNNMIDSEIQMIMTKTFDINENEFYWKVQTSYVEPSTNEINVIKSSASIQVSRDFLLNVVERLDLMKQDFVEFLIPISKEKI